MADELKSSYDDFAHSNQVNALTEFVKSIIASVVSTSFPCVVTEVERPKRGDCAGYVTVKPLIKPRSPKNETLDVVEIPKLPFFRLQHGKAAIVCDPKVGDIGLAVVGKQDISNINGNNSPSAAPTFRQFDPSDSFFIGGYWGQAPETFIEIDDEGYVDIETPERVTVKTKTVKIDCETCTINSSADTTINASAIHLNAPIDGGAGNGARINGSVNATGDVTAGEISLQGHVHGGVDSGPSTTGGPQ